MKKQDYSAKVKIDSKQNITVRNILRSLGLNTSHKGTILIIKAVQFVSASDTDFIVINDIYKLLVQYYKNLNIKQVKMTIKYALDHRIEEKSAKNFESIFGFEYDEYFFTNKCIIEEIARII